MKAITFARSAARALLIPDAAARGYPVHVRPHVRSRLLGGASSLTLSATSVMVMLGVGAPGDAQAQVSCTATSPITCTGSATSTFVLTPAQNPITFDSATNITSGVGAAVLGDFGTVWTVTNQGTLSSGAGALATVSLDSGTVTNFGSITGNAIRGLFFNNLTGLQSNVDNRVGGTISGTVRGIDLQGSGTITNAGTIIGTAQQGIVTSDIATVISGVTVINSGTITGGTHSVQFLNRGANVLVLQTGSVLNGTAAGSAATGATNALILEGTGKADNQFVNFTSLVVQASGLWALNNNSTIGPTSINSGTLVVGDATHPGAVLTSPVTVNSGGALAGQGKVIGDVTVAGGGIIAPGAAAPFSTLSVAGNASFAAGSFFQVAANAAGQSDKLAATGGATLTGGTVQVLAQGSGFFAASTPYTILTAAGGFGGTTFAGVTSNLAFLAPSLSYTANNVTLTLTNNGATFDSVAQTANQRAVAAALNASPADSTLFTAVLNQSVDGARAAFNALSGDVYATTQTVQADQSQLSRYVILGRLEQATYAGAGNSSRASSALGYGGPETAYASMGANAAFPTKAPLAAGAAYVARPHDLTFWTQGLGSVGHLDGDGNAIGANGTFAGFLTGVDAAFGSATRAGFAAGYTRSDVKSGASSVGVDSAQIAAYAGHDLGGPLHLRGGVIYSFDTTSSNRTVLFPDFLDQTKARFSGNVAQVFGEIGYGMTLRNVALEPVAGLAYVHTHQGAFTESGGAAALSGAAADLDIGYSTLGVRAATLVPLGNGTVLVPRASARWQHAFGDLNPVTALAFQSTATAFVVAGVPIAKDAALVQGGFDWRFSQQLKVALDYQGALATTAQTHLVKGAFTRNF